MAVSCYQVYLHGTGCFKYYNFFFILSLLSKHLLISEEEKWPLRQKCFSSVCVYVCVCVRMCGCMCVCIRTHRYTRYTCAQSKKLHTFITEERLMFMWFSFDF